MLKTTLVWLALSTGIFAAVVVADISANGVSAEEALQDNIALAAIIPVATAAGLFASRLA